MRAKKNVLFFFFILLLSLTSLTPLTAAEGMKVRMRVDGMI